MSVRYGRGDGGFLLGPDVIGAGGPNAVLVRDFDGDGRMDIVSSGQCCGTSITLQTAAGEFAPARTILEGTWAGHLATADLNQDGAPDVIDVGGSTEAGSWAGVGLNSGKGQFATTKYAIGVGSSSIAAGDLTGDGAPDLVALDPSLKAFNVAINRGDGTFFSPPPGPRIEDPSQLAIRDWDEDGHLEVALSAEGCTHPYLEFHRWTTAGAFELTMSVPITCPYMTPLACDFNGDGHQEIAMLWPVAPVDPNNTDQQIVILKRRSDTWVRIAHSITFPESFALAAADLDGDWQLDFVVLESYPKKVTLVHGVRATYFGPRVDLDTSGGQPVGVLCADLNEDGRTDLVFRENPDPSRVRVFLNAGNFTFTPGVIIPETRALNSIALQDLNGDGRLDLVEVLANGVTTRLGMGDGTFGGPHILTLEGVLSVFAPADFDGDGILDAGVIRTNGSSIVALHGNGDGGFSKWCELGVPYPVRALAAADVDQDGIADLVAAVSDGWSKGGLVALRGRRVSTPNALQDFAAVVAGDGVHLSWRIAAESVAQLSSVHLQRAAVAPGPYADCTAARLPITLEMSADDAGPPPGESLWYRLVLRWQSGQESVIGPLEVARARPASAGVGVSFDASAGAALQFSYVIRDAHPDVLLRLYDARGRLLRTLQTGTRPPGSGTLTWDRRDAAGRPVARGVYIVRLQAGSERASAKFAVTHR